MTNLKRESIHPWFLAAMGVILMTAGFKTLMGLSRETFEYPRIHPVYSRSPERADSLEGWLFRCPACQHSHYLSRKVYFFNGDPHKPTFSPDFQTGFDDLRCHGWITDGEITFSERSNHTLQQQTVPLPKW